MGQRAMGLSEKQKRVLGTILTTGGVGVEAAQTVLGGVVALRGKLDDSKIGSNLTRLDHPIFNQETMFLD